jgi:hypothetical protein
MINSVVIFNELLNSIIGIKNKLCRKYPERSNLTHYASHSAPEYNPDAISAPVTPKHVGVLNEYFVCDTGNFLVRCI